MSRDLTIYGIEHEQLLGSNIDVIGMADRQKRLLAMICNFDYAEYEKNGIIELISYRSKANCLAIAQVVSDYFESDYAQLGDCDEVGNFPDMLLNKQCLVDVLEWLVLFAQNLGLHRNEIAPEEMLLKKELPWLAEAVGKPYLNGKEFEHFAIYFPLYFEWYEQIKASSYSYYYWEDSF